MNDEREAMLGMLFAKREDVLHTAEGLTDAQARWTPEGRLLPIIGIINHLSCMEWRWVEGRYLGAEFPPRTDEFAVAHDVSLETVLSRYRDRGPRTEEVLRAASSLDAPCLGCEGDGPPAHVLVGFDQPISLRWVLLHLIEETAHHAGHADSTREMLDGSKMRP